MVIRYGELNHIQANAFASLQNLKKIVLNRNKIGTIDHDAFAGLRLRKLKIQDNPSLSDVPYFGDIAHTLVELFLDRNNLTGSYMTGVILRLLFNY